MSLRSDADGRIREHLYRQPVALQLSAPLSRLGPDGEQGVTICSYDAGGGKERREPRLERETMARWNRAFFGDMPPVVLQGAPLPPQSTRLCILRLLEEELKQPQRDSQQHADLEAIRNELQRLQREGGFELPEEEAQLALKGDEAQHLKTPDPPQETLFENCSPQTTQEDKDAEPELQQHSVSLNLEENSTNPQAALEEEPEEAEAGVEETELEIEN